MHRIAAIEFARLFNNFCCDECAGALEEIVVSRDGKIDAVCSDDDQGKAQEQQYDTANHAHILSAILRFSGIP
jgi:alpha-D-ribose 1-methylphosphonate 5-phosphate C-P lyase